MELFNSHDIDMEDEKDIYESDVDPISDEDDNGYETDVDTEPEE